MVTAELDLSNLTRKLRAMPGQVDSLMAEELTRNARLLVSSSGNVPGLVQVTPPNSEGVHGRAARKQGEAVIRGDVYRVYGTPGALFKLIAERNQAAANGFWRAVKKKDWEAANKIAAAVTGARLREFDDGEAHQKARSRSTGRVSKAQKHVMFVANPKWIRDYIKTTWTKVGLLAAAPLAAANAELGALKGVPDWVSRHRPNWASITKGGDMTSRYIEIRIASPYVVREMFRRFKYVLGYRIAAMKRETPYRLRAAIKKLNLGN